MSDGYNLTGLALFEFVFVIVLGVVVIAAVGGYLLYSIALSLFFRKVGVEPWIGWVPVYAQWKWLEVGGQQGFWSLFLLLPSLNIVAWVFIYIGMWRTTIAFKQSTGIFVLGIFFPFVWLFIMAARSSVYDPELITRAGFPPPLAGDGAVAHGAGY